MLAGLIDPCGVVAAANVAKILEQAVITDLEQIKNRQMHQKKKTPQGVHELCVVSRCEYSPLLSCISMQDVLCMLELAD